MRLYMIVNPVAGGGKALEQFERLKAYFDSCGADYEYVMTERICHATELAEAAYSAGERYIVAVGGDGTINEVASALCRHNDVVMGVCSFGTGNDFVRVLGLPTEPEKIGDILLNGEPQPVDMGMAGERPFTNVGGMGFDVDVVVNTQRYKTKFHGMVPYLLGIVRSLMHLKSIPVTITADGETFSEEVTICAVGNGSHIGGGMAALPEASAQDGLFDVCVIKKVKLPKLLQLLPKFIKGKHLGTRQVKYFRAREVSFDCGREPLQIDGELGEYAPVTFRVLPGALSVMLPKKA